MAPTAAMLILGHHSRTVSQTSHSSSSKSTPVSLMKSSLAKWVYKEKDCIIAHLTPPDKKGPAIEK